MLKKETKKIFEVDISDIISEVLKLSDLDWKKWIIDHPNYYGSKDKVTFNFIWLDKLKWRFGDKVDLTFYNQDHILWNYIKPIIKKLENFYDGTCVKCFITNLKSGGMIGEHIDMAESLHYVHRCHIPIQTHQDVKFIIQGTNVQMGLGEVFEINNQALHSVLNNSPIDRIHILCDIMPNEIYRKYI